MKYAVRYLSKGGNTKKLALAIAEELGIKAESIEKGINETVDVLFLGTAVYAFSIDNEMKKFINELDKVKKVAIFSTSAILKKRVYKQIKKLCNKKGIPCFEEYFYCAGEFNKTHVGRPNADDLNNAKEFARKIFRSNEE